MDELPRWKTFDTDEIAPTIHPVLLESLRSLVAESRWMSNNGTFKEPPPHFPGIGLCGFEALLKRIDEGGG